MKKYEKPIVMINEDLAEGVYAASGASASAVDCWVIVNNGTTLNTVPNESARELQFDAVHSGKYGHAPNATWVISLNQPITAVTSSSGLAVEISGSTVSVKRAWGNANESENWGFALRFVCDSYETLAVLSSYIVCP